MADFKSSTGPVKSTFDDVVDKLQEMNKDQTALQKEAVIYSNELQEYVQNEGHAMSNAQLRSMQDLILALQEGRLDDIEASKEELLRQRAEEKRDEERNDTLLDTLKQLKKQFKLLKANFDDKGGVSLLGLIFRTALVGFLIGIIQGIGSVYVNIFKKLGLGIQKGANKIVKLFQLDVLFRNIRNSLGDFKNRFIAFFKNSRFAKFFQSSNKGSFFSTAFNGFMNIAKDIGKLIGNQIGNMKKIGQAIFGLFTGAPLAFKGLTNLKFGIKADSALFKKIGDFINFVKGPFVSAFAAIGDKVRGAFTTIINTFGRTFDKIAAVFTGGKEGNMFAKLGDRIQKFFQKSGPLARFFGFFSAIQGAFVQLGKVIGSKILFPIFGAIGAIKGAFADIKGIVDQPERIIRGLVGSVRGAFRILIGEFLDFIKQAIGFVIDLLPGVEGVREKFKEFSFADFFDQMFFAVSDYFVEMVNAVRDTIDDISWDGIFQNMGLQIMAIFAKIADFPIAIAKGAWAALTSPLLASGEERMAAFSEAFAEQMNNGLKSAVLDKMVTADGINAETGEDMQYKSNMYQSGNAPLQILDARQNANNTSNTTNIMGTGTENESAYIRMVDMNMNLGRYLGGT